MLQNIKYFEYELMHMYKPWMFILNQMYMYMYTYVCVYRYMHI